MRLFICFATVVFLFFCFCIGTSHAGLPQHPIDCSNTYDNDGCYEHPECCAIAPLIHMDDFDGVRVYYCDSKVNGDCSYEGLNILSAWGVYNVVVNSDPEFGCDDTSCECEWQECYKAPAVEAGEMGECE